MNNSSTPAGPPHALDELVTELLDCGGVLSQMISGMVEFDASGHAAPGLVPIPEMAHGLISSVLEEVCRRHSAHDIRIAARIVGEVTVAISENIFSTVETADRRRPRR